jgi:iron complex transport system substrate-binding protein
MENNVKAFASRSGGKDSALAGLRASQMPGLDRMKNLFTLLLIVAVLVLTGLPTVIEAGVAPPDRIVSLGPTVTEKLYLLGVQDRLVGVTTFCERPPAARMKEKIGSVTQVNVEKITALKPDMILATSLTDRKAVERLKRLGFPVKVFPEPGSYREMNEQFMELAQLTGTQQKARAIVETSEKQVEAIRQQMKDLPKPKVFVQIGARPLFTATKNSFLNDFIEFAGGINIARDTTSGFYSKEEVLKHNPDVIIVVAMEMPTENEKKSWQKFPSLSAVKKNRIFIVDSFRTCSPTPVTFVEALREIASLLHPEVRIAR